MHYSGCISTCRIELKVANLQFNVSCLGRNVEGWQPCDNTNKFVSIREISGKNRLVVIQKTNFRQFLKSGNYCLAYFCTYGKSANANK